MAAPTPDPSQNTDRFRITCKDCNKKNLLPEIMEKIQLNFSGKIKLKVSGHFLLWFCLMSPLAAQPSLGHSHASHLKSGNAEISGMVNGEVIKIDSIKKTIMIRHEAIKSLRMPAMTMVFKVKSPQMLQGLMKGERIQFMAIQENDQIVVTKIQRDICE